MKGAGRKELGESEMVSCNIPTQNFSNRIQQKIMATHVSSK